MSDVGVSGVGVSGVGVSGVGVSGVGVSAVCMSDVGCHLWSCQVCVYICTVLQCPPSMDFFSGLIPGADHPETLPEGVRGSPHHTCHSWTQDREREIHRW